MKKAPVMLLFAFIMANAIGQNATDVENTPEALNYLLLVEAPVFECDIMGNIMQDSSFKIAPQYAIFTIINNKGTDSLIIRFWGWDKKKDSLKYNRLNFDEKTGEKRYFLIAVNDFNLKSLRRYDKNMAPTVGTVIVPVKIRFSKFDFSKDITIGTTAGLRWRMTNYSDNYFNLLIGIGITSVTLDSLSTYGKIRKATDRPALTPSLGFVFEFHNNIQMGLFIGMDYISSKENIRWRYQGEPWLSIGLGYTILSKQGSSVEKKEGTNK